MDQQYRQPIISEGIFCFLSCCNKHKWDEWEGTSGVSLAGCSRFQMPPCFKIAWEKTQPLQWKTWEAAVSWEQRQSQSAVGCSTLKVTPVHSDLAHTPITCARELSGWKNEEFQGWKCLIQTSVSKQNSAACAGFQENRWESGYRRLHQSTCVRLQWQL